MSNTKTKERPIIFSGPMVRAIIEGRKTQARRIVKPRYDWYVADGVAYYQDYVTSEPCPVEIPCPYGSPGGRLWVRETTLLWRDNSGPCSVAAYAADGYQLEAGEQWTPSIHMPRWASRLTLEVVGVRVERLQGITEDDAISEGAQCAGVPASLTNSGAFAKLWESINGPGSWSANPWVWVIEFRNV